MRKKYKISSITITHDMACAKMTADRIILLKDASSMQKAAMRS